jgi:hypothetical protein
MLEGMAISYQIVQFSSGLSIFSGWEHSNPGLQRWGDCAGFAGKKRPQNQRFK